MSKQTDLLNLTDAISVSGSNVGIGTTSPTFTSAYGGLHVHSTYPEIHLTGTDSGSGAGDGFKIQKNSANNVYLWNYENALMAFGTNNSERMRLDSSGNLLVGKTDTTFNNDGIRLDPDGRLISTNTSNNALILNRTGTDGSIASFNKDGSTVGSIGTLADDLSIGNLDTGLIFQGAGDRITPFNPATNSYRDAAIDLGKDDRRFKDLYLSGGVVQNGVKATTTATTQVAIETFAHASYDGAKVVITAATSADTYVTELLIATNGTTAVATEYGQIGTGSALATYDVDISGADVRILATPASTTSTTFRVAMTLT